MPKIKCYKFLYSKLVGYVQTKEWVLGDILSP